MANTREDPIQCAIRYYQEGWRNEKGLIYNKETGEVITADEWLEKQEVYSNLKSLCDFGIKSNEYDDIQELKDTVQCYHGKFYVEGLPVNNIQIREYVHEMFPKYDCSAIENIVKYATIYLAVDKIPPYNFPNNVPKDNGFRFPKEAYQLLHYFLYEPKQKYILTIMSEGNMGKSTFTNFLRACFKGEYYSADTKSMNQFSTSFYAGNRLIVFSDCTSKYIEDSHILKQISGKDDVQIEAKGQQAYSSTIDAYMLFIGNEPLSYNVLDSGLQNRFVNIPWNNNIPKEKRDTKWLDYEWTWEEIVFQLNLAKDIEPLDFEKLQADTIKESLKHKSAFYEPNYNIYNDPNNPNSKNKYNEENYKEFWKLIKKYYTREEWDNLKKQKDIENLSDMWTYEG